MRRAGGISIIIFVLFSVTIACEWVFADSQTPAIISGKVSDLDWVEPTITVRYFDPAQGGYDGLSIAVPREAKIIRGASTITLAEVNLSDPVTVIYYDDGLSGLKAIKISDFNLGNR